MKNLLLLLLVVVSLVHGLSRQRRMCGSRLSQKVIEICSRWAATQFDLSASPLIALQPHSPRPLTNHSLTPASNFKKCLLVCPVWRMASRSLVLSRPWWPPAAVIPVRRRTSSTTVSPGRRRSPSPISNSSTIELWPLVWLRIKCTFLTHSIPGTRSLIFFEENVLESRRSGMKSSLRQRETKQSTNQAR